MRALTVHQPWAYLIAEEAKRIENRTWGRLDFKGPLFVHAGKSRESMFSLHDLPSPALRKVKAIGKEGLARGRELAFGAIVAVAGRVECVRIEDLFQADRFPFANGPWCWVLSDVHRLEVPVEAKGAQGLWIPSAELVALVEAELAKGARRCDDGAVCHHGCPPDRCFRREQCGPLSETGCGSWEEFDAMRASS